MPATFIGEIIEFLHLKNWISNLLCFLFAELRISFSGISEVIVFKRKEKKQNKWRHVARHGG